MEERELAVISASAGRRYFGVGALYILGVLVVYLALTSPPSGLHWQIFLLALGIGALVLGQIMWRATAYSLILTETELRESSGLVLARIEDIQKVDRGMFAMKPSNGFNIILKEPAKRVWRPGLWWRFGRRIAIGGVTSGRQTRPVADILTLKLSELSQ
ncbi:hypothetical protein [Thalassococcus lentus]|uniref:PH domain-containing protein n=1 Tax=Thalassococcus lentus TaxID=1210524 RepID=A0ABT4XW71_9RHOB|nr:hypothetical protein [Thalassococcus lentus]MDA7426095.1 hypothetical protein [Thalassococcus lentus]